MIAILDYDTAHSQAMHALFTRVGASAQIVNSQEALERSAKIVLPPGSSFTRMVRCIRDRGYLTPLFRAIDQHRPVLGVAQGLHLLMDVSYEEGQHTGLGVIPGKAGHFEFGDEPAARVSTKRHTGWSEVRWSNGCPLLAGLTTGERFYFDHDYYAEPLDERAIAATSTHGLEFPAVLSQTAVYGTQFLLDRSGTAGEKVLLNFSRL